MDGRYTVCPEKELLLSPLGWAVKMTKTTVWVQKSHIKAIGGKE